jgi:hypothetical protein
MVQPHIAGGSAEINLVQNLECAWGNMLLKAGGFESVIEQWRNTVALGQTQEVRPVNGGESDVAGFISADR